MLPDLRYLFWIYIEYLKYLIILSWFMKTAAKIRNIVQHVGRGALQQNPGEAVFQRERWVLDDNHDDDDDDNDADGDDDNHGETLSLNLLLFAEAAEIVKDICVAVKFLHDMNIAHR